MISKKISSILAVILVFLISIAVHFPYLNFPTKFTEPEIKYLNQIRNYFDHTDFELTQPPLATLFYTFIINMQYDTVFPYKNKIQFNIYLRIIPALLSSLILPIITIILILYDVPISISFLCGVILAFEPSFSALNRLFNPNSFFYFFSVLTILVSKILEMNLSNSRYYIFLQIESILTAITICSDSSGIVILFVLILQPNRANIFQIKHDSKNTQNKSKIKEFWETFKYHLIYSFALFILSIFTHIYLVSGPSNKTPVYAQFFYDISTIMIPANLSEMFTIKKLRNIYISDNIHILNNPAILLVIYIGAFLSFFYCENTFLIPAFASFFLAFRFKEELLWRTPFLFILLILSLGLAMQNLSHLITNLILISAFCCSLLFYVILFSKSYGGQIVL